MTKQDKFLIVLATVLFVVLFVADIVFSAGVYYKSKQENTAPVVAVSGERYHGCP